MAPGMSADSVAWASGRTRISLLVVSLPHQSDDSSATVVPSGVASTMLRARVISLTTWGLFGSV